MSILSFDLSRSLRHLKPDKRSEPLRRREKAHLPFVTASIRPGEPILFDTTVYIDALQGRLPQDVAALIRLRQIEHSAVAVAELAYGLGRLDPSHPDTPRNVKIVRQAIEAIPERRLSAPDTHVVVEAGILAGIAARLRTAIKDHALLNDAILFLQAQKNGWCLLSRNVADVDALLQLVPKGRALLYEQA